MRKKHCRRCPVIVKVPTSLPLFCHFGNLEVRPSDGGLPIKVACAWMFCYLTLFGCNDATQGTAVLSNSHSIFGFFPWFARLQLYCLWKRFALEFWTDWPCFTFPGYYRELWSCHPCPQHHSADRWCDQQEQKDDAGHPGCWAAGNQDGRL